MNGELLKKRRLELGLTRKELASRLGIGEQTVANLERGMKPRATMIGLLARTIGVPVEDLVPNHTSSTTKISSAS